MKHNYVKKLVSLLAIVILAFFLACENHKESKVSGDSNFERYEFLVIDYKSCDTLPKGLMDVLDNYKHFNHDLSISFYYKILDDSTLINGKMINISGFYLGEGTINLNTLDLPVVLTFPKESVERKISISLNSAYCGLIVNLMKDDKIFKTIKQTDANETYLELKLDDI